MEKENSISLSLESIKSIPLEKFDKDFKFYVNGKCYETTRIIADILSPIINKYHYEDESINEFTITFDDQDIEPTKQKDKDYFIDFLNLSNFEPREVDSISQKYYSQYFLQLGNIKEYFKLHQEYFENLTSENVIDRLNFMTEKSSNFHTNDYLDLDKFISYIATHFNEISKEKMKSIDIYFIEKVLESESLKIEDEDSLLSFILDLYNFDNKYSVLFQYVVFQNVTEETLEKFINQFNIEYINKSIWASICQRLLPSKEVQVSDSRYSTNKSMKSIIEFKIKKGSEMKGIINFLTEKTGGNIHNNKTIEITASSTTSNSPENTVDFQNSNCFYSKSEPNSFICYDFKERQIQLTNYSIRRHHYFQNGCNLKSWIIEGSNDGSKWTKIDEHSNDSSLNGSQNSPDQNIATFSVLQSNSFYRFIRLRQTGQSWRNDNNICIEAVEMYGKLYQP